MNKLVLLAFVLVLAGCNSIIPRELPVEDFSVMIYSQNGTNFSGAVGGFDEARIDLCGLNGFFGQGQAQISLENAPTGVILSLPSNAKLDVLEICPAYAASDLLVEPDRNVKLSIAEDAELGNAQPFYLVIESKNVTKRLAVTFTIFTIPAQ